LGFYNPEDGIPVSQRRENHKSYTGLPKVFFTSDFFDLDLVVVVVVIVIIIIIITTGTTALCEPWPSSGFLNNLIFTVRGCQPHAQPPVAKLPPV
jgi:hypothetical protein